MQESGGVSMRVVSEATEGSLSDFVKHFVC
jgi:hypothetical protein